MTTNNNVPNNIPNNTINNRAYIGERTINKPSSLSVEQMKYLSSLSEKCVCKINKLNEAGTGFVCKILYQNEFRVLPVLITNKYVLDENNIKINDIIHLSFNNDQIIRTIKITNSRKAYIDEDLDITIIEIKPNEDQIYDYLEIDDYNNKNYKNEEICILEYPNETSLSFGKLIEINDRNINHNCPTKYDSSGSPIINLSNNRIIGIHKGVNKLNKNIQMGTLIKYVIERFNKAYPQKNITTRNYIIGEMDIKDWYLNYNVQIINSFDEVQRKYYCLKGDKNEKEIKENCFIKINNIL
jgi:hypothetical protein